ncbi:predicted protein [Naegleria gruberi]|uniref:Predicted protein n=1 Tax=Naegleria gruberi TaxID=5762 RepID=D2VSM0_NAEGR|nr:uncharacterized protein NAEGRDRAFT_71987 [Naegleria gruberi]EFC40213.1 predicted protein [Naegleria gruberi]|eukprot:XP_002672957.1 predicted protein [Naegleria gruberi strain NEG-M]
MLIGGSSNSGRKRTLALLLLSIVALISKLSTAQQLKVRDSKVSNGEKASTNEFPFIVSLQQADDISAKSYSHTCGASIINSKYLLSAAHCFSPPDTLPWIAVYGGNSVSDVQRKYIKIKNIHVHPQYSDSNNNVVNDIAILELESAMTLDGKTAKAAYLEIGSIPIGFSSIVAGWGTTVDTQPLPTDLMKVTVPVVDMSKCNAINLDASSPKQICAGDGKGHDR